MISRYVSFSILLLLSTIDPIGILSAPVTAQAQVRIVEVTGLGKDARSALQNAAENALTQVSGTFVRNDTTIERTSEIRGAIRSESRRIDNRMSEYAQGTISSIQVLSTSQDGLTTRVEARVSVRLSELKAFIESVDEATATIGAEVSINSSLYQRRATSAEDIFLDTVLRPIVTGTAVRFRIGQPIGIKQAPNDLVQRLNATDFPSRTIIMPVDAYLDEAFIANAKQALMPISSTVRSSRPDFHDSCTQNYEYSMARNTFHFFNRGGVDCYKIAEIEMDNRFYGTSEGLSLRDAWKATFVFKSSPQRNDYVENLSDGGISLDVSFSNESGVKLYGANFNICTREFYSPPKISVALPDFEGRCYIPLSFGSPSLSVYESRRFYLIVDPQQPWFQDTKSITIKIKSQISWTGAPQRNR